MSKFYFANALLTTLVIGFVLEIVLVAGQTPAPVPDINCECQYLRDAGGCIISRGPVDTGYKCRCRKNTFWIWTGCNGSRIQCSPNEDCPANCANKECCELSGGDCKGYY